MQICLHKQDLLHRFPVCRSDCIDALEPGQFLFDCVIQRSGRMRQSKPIFVFALLGAGSLHCSLCAWVGGAVGGG